MRAPLHGSMKNCSTKSRATAAVPPHSAMRRNTQSPSHRNMRFCSMKGNT